MQIKINFLMMMGFLLIAINVQAGEIGPRLQAELQLQSLWISPAFIQDIPVVVTFKDKANISAIQGKLRKQRIRKAIRSLKNKSKSVQNTVRQMLYSHWIDRVDDLWLINGLAFKASPALLKILAALPEVDVVELDYQIKAPATGSGGSAPAEWNLDMIAAPLLWDIGITGNGAVVANMDTGVDRTDPDINFAWRNGNNSWYDPNCQPFPPQLPDATFAADAGCPNSPQIDLSLPRDSAGNSTGHGTETMGVMVGGQASGTAIGVAPDSKWIATKIFNDSGIAFPSRIHLAFQWLLNPDNDLNTDDAPDVINASWVLAGTDVGKCVPEFQTDIQNLKSAGIAVVFAAGNNGANGSPNTSTSPGNNPAGYAVGAVDMGGLVASFSSRGPAPLALALDGTDCNDGLFPELVAPGVSITTTKTDIFGSAQYSSVSGTSFAAPHVAGAMALLKSRIPTLTVAQLETTLLQSAVQTIPDTIPGPDDNYGYGALNVANAYDVICPATGPDSDGDGVPDACDNCVNVSNGPLTSVNGTLISLGQIQLDSDRDGYGNTCDADFNQNCVVDISDFIQFRNVFGSSDNEADFNMSGSVDITDFIIFRNTFGNGPGISGQAPVPDAQNCHL